MMPGCADIRTDKILAILQPPVDIAKMLQTPLRPKVCTKFNRRLNFKKRQDISPDNIRLMLMDTVNVMFDKPRIGNRVIIDKKNIVAPAFPHRTVARMGKSGVRFYNQPHSVSGHSQAVDEGLQWLGIIRVVVHDKYFI